MAYKLGVTETQTRHFTKTCIKNNYKTKGYRSHTDPSFKSAKILKIVDVFKLQASLFMYDLEHDLLPKSFINVVMKKVLIQIKE